MTVWSFVMAKLVGNKGWKEKAYSFCTVVGCTSIKRQECWDALNLHSSCSKAFSNGLSQPPYHLLIPGYLFHPCLTSFLSALKANAFSQSCCHLLNYFWNPFRKKWIWAPSCQIFFQQSSCRFGEKKILPDNSSAELVTVWWQCGQWINHLGGSSWLICG